jgi:hypothetical protein
MRYSEILLEAGGMPFRSFSMLYHVGSLNAADKGNDSYEGAGLSVSLHPEEWMEIARISGPVWQATRSGNKFLDFYRLNKRQKAAIINWGLAEGYLAQTAQWRVDYYDDDYEENRFLLFDNEEEAQQEAEEYDTVPKEIKNATDGTAKLMQRTKQGRVSPGMGFELLCPVYADDVLTIDGVWWNERLDPEVLSAPRGVIVPSQIPHWRFLPRT